MRVYERGELQTRMIRNMRARSDEITYFGPGPIRAFFYAVATELQHLYYRLFRADLRQDAQRALGTDLDEIAAARGITRLGAAKSSVVLEVTGTIGTVIPAGFQVKADSGVLYQTTEAATITAQSTNPGASAITKIVAESLTTGSGSAVPRGAITQMVDATNVTDGTLSAVVNPGPSVGGRDAETDAELRMRVVQYLATLNHGTRAFYEAQVRIADPTVVRVHLAKGVGPHTVRVAVVNRSGASYGSEALQAIAATLAPVTPVQTTMEVVNLAYTEITITMTGSLVRGAVARDVLEQAAKNLTTYLDWSTWPFGQDVQWDDLLAIVSNTTGIDTIQRGTFTPSADVAVADTSLPKLVSLSFTDVATQTTTTLSGIADDFPRLD